MSTVDQLPAGSWPGGFHLIDFGERKTNLGVEAFMVFEGPPLNRHQLLAHYFPQWFVQRTPDGSQCCVVGAPSTPRPYPDLAATLLVPVAPGLTERWCNAFAPYELYADTWEMGRGDPNCTPYALPCDNNVFDAPLYFGGGREDRECSCSITINFRRKHHAGWPQHLTPCATTISGLVVEENQYWLPPIIPWGTFIEAYSHPAIEVVSAPSDALRWNANKAFPIPLRPESPEASDCETRSITHSGAEFCTAQDDIDVIAEKEKQKITRETVVVTETFEIRWSGVPLFDYARIRRLLGRVNETLWLGYPPEALRFSDIEPEEVAEFGGVDLYNLRLKFDVRMAPVELPPAAETITAEDIEDWLSHGIWNGYVGIWNRGWWKVPIITGHPPQDSRFPLWTHWIPLKLNDQDECAIPWSFEPSIYPVACFSDIFQLKACPPQPLLQLPESV